MHHRYPALRWLPEKVSHLATAVAIVEVSGFVKLRRRLIDLDAQLGLAPRNDESWLAFHGRRKKARYPLAVALGEAARRIADLERRVAELEAHRP
ncbi:MAG: hypothetical protein JWO22_2058 [Frankiales bacterium]|nr:hypothetical protein [Frankiales bacterium]